MNFKEVDFTECLKETIAPLTEKGKGLLLTSVDAKGKPNTMAIGWGVVGSIWGLPMFCVLVRPSRYTYGLIEQTGDFTVNVPTEDMEEVVAFCGSASGRDVDKFIEMDLTAVHVPEIKSPIIRECPINFVCKVVHKNDVIPKELDPSINERAYKTGDYHRVYYGEILKTLRSK